MSLRKQTTPWSWTFLLMSSTLSQLQTLSKPLWGEIYLAASVILNGIFLALAIALYRKTGYRQFGRHANYYADHEAALRFEKLLSEQIPQPRPAPPYWRQTLDFTCGPACVAMA